MRILHVIPQFPYFGARTIVGGHASCLLTLSLAQYEAGEHVTILSYTPGQYGSFEIEQGPFAYSLFPEAKTQTVRFGLDFCRNAVQWLREHRGEFDVVHVHSGYSDYCLLSHRLKTVGRLPTLHSMYCPINPKGRSNLPGIRSLIRRWANQLDWIGGISENVASSMAAYGMQHPGFVRPAVDVSRYVSNGNESVRARLGIKPDELLVLFVGNATPQKNLLGALRAVHLLRGEFPKLRLIVTTELRHTSTDSALARLARIIRDLDLESCVIQKGIIGDMPELMCASDILVAPFLDSYGPSDYFIAALEAMAASKPVVVSNVGGMSEIISNDIGTLVNPRDPKSIASGLRVYCSDPALRKLAGANARRLMETSFSPPKIASSYRSIYRRIVG